MLPPNLIKILIIIFIFFNSTLSHKSCPNPCDCKSARFKDKVNCTDKGLTDVPEFYTGMTCTHLYLDHNELQIIESGRFNSLTGLKHLSIKNSGVSAIENYAFKRLSNLNLMDLTHNYIKQISPEIFYGLSNLLVLKLDFNQLAYIEPNVFWKLKKLVSLYLSNNGIIQLHTSTFAGLHSLKFLHLIGNNIKELPPEVFEPTPMLIKIYLRDNHLTKLQSDCFNYLPSIAVVNLYENPLVCDCVFTYLVVKSTNVKWTGHCDLPEEMTGIPLSKLEGSNSSCAAPKITGVPPMVSFQPGENGMIPCVVSGDPSPTVEWTKLRSNMDKDRYEIMKNGTLIIHNVNDEDNGIMECHANNIKGKAKRSVKVVIEKDYEGSPPVFTLLPINQEVTQGQPILRFDCAAKGDPIPHIIWLHNNEMLLRNNRISMISNGSLFLKDVSMLDQGSYICRAMNIYGKVEYAAILNVLTAPTFIKVPVDQTVNIGELVEMMCTAQGNPKPNITWYKDFKVVEASENIILDYNNERLRIVHVSNRDSGTYTCRAMSNSKTIEISCTLTVEDDQSPRILVKPVKTDVYKGMSVQLPCEINSESEAVVEWTKDGSSLPNENKYEVSSSGSLLITDVWLNDTGAYQCRVHNDYGEDSALALLTVQDFNLPSDEYVNGVLFSSITEIDEAINNTIEYMLKNNSVRIDVHNLFHVARYPNAKAREIARAAEIYERTLDKLAKRMLEYDTEIKAQPFDYHDILSKENLELISRLSGCTAHRQVNNCSDVCFHRKYRSIDGTCNNLAHPMWGSSLTGFRRILPPQYENGVSQPVGWNKDIKYNGYGLPSARLVSTSVISTDNITEDKKITHMVMQWGQWLDHDLDHSLPSVSSQTWDGVDCKKTCDSAAPCFPIQVPPLDPRISNRRCIDFIRTSSVCGSGTTSAIYGQLQVREQINQLTSYIDASQVYGFENAVAQDLRNLRSDDGLLRVGIEMPGGKNLLPTTGLNAMDCRRNLDESTRSCFVSGDIRANEQIGLAAMHTLWMREHNRLAIKLKALNPSWDGDKIYQESRKIVGAQMQFITYDHWLPIILGPEGYEKLGNYKGYDPNINPSISNVFATAALRFGHTIINPVLNRLDENFETIPQGPLLLRHAFFSPWRITDEGGIDPLLRGMFATPAKLKTSTQNLNKELTEKLFYSAHAVALDLAAINIQRGRDHAIPPYTEWRQFCNMTEVVNFDDLKNEISDMNVREKLRELYGSVHNVDVWVGAVLEDVVEGGKVGPLISCLLIEQFRRLRDGDRFWYEYPSTFSPEQLNEIKKTSLSRVLCDNGDNIDTISDNVFYNRIVPNEMVSCEEIRSMDLRPWIDCDTSCGFSERRLTGNSTLDLETTECTNHERLKYTEEYNGALKAEIKRLQQRIEDLEEQKHIRSDRN